MPDFIPTRLATIGEVQVADAALAATDASLIASDAALATAAGEATSAVAAVTTAAAVTSVDLIVAKLLTANGRWRLEGVLAGVDPVAGTIRSEYEVDVTAFRIAGVLSIQAARVTPIRETSGVLRASNPVVVDTNVAGQFVLRLYQVLAAPSTSWRLDAGIIRYVP